MSAAQVEGKAPNIFGASSHSLGSMSQLNNINNGSVRDHRMHDPEVADIHEPRLSSSSCEWSLLYKLVAAKMPNVAVRRSLKTLSSGLQS
jgi:hypothetical protein